ncbi:Uncharacterised protein [Vibrio cholerae]|nr:Uncharacterised protein [Vibrio cholerae]
MQQVSRRVVQRNCRTALFIDDGIHLIACRQYALGDHTVMRNRVT